jgi:superfamily II DNA or RNA helicase
MIQFRPYQAQLVANIKAAFAAGHQNVMAVLPTGAGKTVVFSGVLSEQDYIAQLVAGSGAAATIAIAHRQELVGQMSLALARCGVRHRVVAPKQVVRRIVKMHMVELGANFVDPRAHCVCAGVDTLIARPLEVQQWAHRIAMWVIDEGHHLLADNKWGKAAAMFPHARGLVVTATPVRADGKGLGRHAHGVLDAMVTGPTMRELINDGWLTDYRIIAPRSDIDLSGVTTGADGDFSKAKLKTAVRKSHLIGDVAEHYLKWTPGKRGVTFATDVETAADIAAKFNKAGVRAEVVSAKTPDNLRADIIEKFRRGDLMMLVNVDLFGEGFDLPAIEVVIMARPTESFALYAQQWGRALRLMLDCATPETREGRLAAIAASRKPKAVIIDHVGNVERFKGPPDAVHNQIWSLDGRDRKTRGPADDVIPLRSCLNVECLQVYERFYAACPYCGHKPEPAARNAPEFVDGDLAELDAETMSRLRGEVGRVDQSPADYRTQLQRQHCPVAGQHANVKAHVRRQDAQQLLRTAMEWWAAHHRDAGRSDAEAYRRFYHAFGVDVLSAMSLDTEQALGLAGKVSETIGR